MGNPSRAWVIGYGEDAGMAKADYRTKARECYQMAAMAPSPADQATWLKLASEWLAMSSGRGVPVPMPTARRRMMTPGIHCCRDDDYLAKAVRHSAPAIERPRHLGGARGLLRILGVPAPHRLR